VASTLFAACSDSKPPPAGGTTSSGGLAEGGVSPVGADAASATDGATAAEGGKSCNNLQATGADLLPQTPVTDPMPAATGGNIMLGTYWLTERDLYAGGMPDALFVQRALLIDATTINVVEGTASSATGTPTLKTQTSTYQVFATVGLSMRESCPGSPEVTNAHYSVAGGQVTLYYPDLGTAEVYALQP
jgi:hypothetical protein